MKQKKCFMAVAASMLVAAASFTSCSNQDNIIVPDAPEVPDMFDEGSLVVNGRCEGKDASNFIAKEWRNGEQYWGPANLKWDEVTPRNHSVVVEVRSKEEAEAAGVTNFVDYDSQLFITFGEDQALNPKDQIRLTMKVKADEEATVGTQSHTSPGNYIHWYAVGDVKFTQEWTDFDSNWITVGDAGAWGQAQAGMYTIAFNLSKGIHNRYFLDDIRVEVVRHDTFEDGNFVKNCRLEGDDASSFACHEWRTQDAQFDGPANIVADPANPDNHCAAVVIRSSEEAAAAGNMTKDGNGNFADWDSQFFITLGEENTLKAGDKIRLIMDVKADVDMTGVGTQSHLAPGAYKHWACVGNVDFTTEWKTFDSGWKTVDANMATMYTIAFNLAKGIHNTVYFDNIRVEIEKAPEVVKWKNIMVNGNLEGEDYSGIVCRESGKDDAANVVAGEGVDGSKAAVINSIANATNAWDTQFFVFVPEKLAAGTAYKIKFSVRSKDAATISTQTHSTPGNYLGGAFGNFDSKAEWTVIEKEGTIEKDDTQTIAFNLNENKTLATSFYFDNIEFYIPEK
jgi:hypothetical protein